MNTSHANRFMEMLVEEVYLAYQAKSGDTNAFVKLYDACVERVYRYIYFLAPNTKVAEALTFKVFFKAWEHLEAIKMFNSSFIIWLYSIAQDQVAAYYHTHKMTVAPDDDFITAVRGGNFRGEFQLIRDGLQFLSTEQQQVLILKFMAGMSDGNIGRLIVRRTDDVRVLQMQGLEALTGYLNETELRIDVEGFQRVFEGCLMRLSNGASSLGDYLARYPEYAARLNSILETVRLLNLGRDVTPLRSFREYTHDALIQYLRSHPRQRYLTMPIFQRSALTFAMLVAAFLVTGTVHAQSVLPGDNFYSWKRTSEKAWRALSPDPVATDIILAERRLTEWVKVAGDSTYNGSAKSDYLEVLARLESANDVETLKRIVSALQLQQQTLIVAGLPAPELDNYLNDVVNTLPIDVFVPVTPTAVEPTETLTAVPTHLVPTKTEVPTEITLTETDVPTEVAPTETKVPTEIASTETEVPTEVMPTETEVPTEIVPTKTEVPTETVPPTVAPTFTPEVIPTEEVK
jgi:DNA-directed RNA polymerase specialized sigma24 family protein